MAADSVERTSADCIRTLAAQHPRRTKQSNDSLISAAYTSCVRQLRSALLKHPLLAVFIGLAGLILRLAVPAGFMPALDHGQLTLTICSGYGTPAMGAAHDPSSSGSAMGHSQDSGNTADSSCAFADLSLSLIGGADPVQLTAALLFIIAASLFFATLLPPRAALRLRPPLRGPPLPA